MLMVPRCRLLLARFQIGRLEDAAFNSAMTAPTSLASRIIRGNGGSLIASLREIGAKERTSHQSEGAVSAFVGVFAICYSAPYADLVVTMSSFR